jgi:hypothetical protein
VFGKRQPNGSITGDYWDVTKGTRMQTGVFAATQYNGVRSFSFTQLCNGCVQSQQTRLEPDYRVDLDEMAQTIDKAFRGKVVGFGYAIVKDGQVVRKGGGGVRRYRINKKKKDLPFNAYTENDGGSTGKLTTAATLIRALTLRGKNVDALVKDYLPAKWKRGTGVSTLTFRQLLNHSAQLYYAGSTLCKDDPYDCLKQAFEKGRTRPRNPKTPKHAPAEYHNIHFTAMRLLVAFVVKKSKMTNLFASEKNTEKLNEGFSKVFRDYTVDIMKGAGVNVGFTWRTSNYAWTYDWPKTLREQVDDTSYLRSGSGSLRASAYEYGKFLAALDSGKIVAPDWYAAMKSGYMGFDLLGRAGKLTGGLGEYWRKNGACGGCGSQAIVFPDHYAAYLTYNSGGQTSTDSRESIMRNAWVNALD